MAEGRRHSLSTQSDIEQILLEAQNRWLRPVEICEILRNYQKYGITPEPPNRPPGGSLFLFDRNVERHFRKDGHNWRKKKDGTIVKESHEKLKIGSVDVLHCYYAHGEENEYFQRRSYWMLEGDLMHIVLVHYRDLKGNRINYSRTRDPQETSQSAHSGSPISSCVLINNDQVLSRTMDTSNINSVHTSKLDVAQSDGHQASSRDHSFFNLQQSEDRPVINSHIDVGLLNSYFSGSRPTDQSDYQGKQLSIPGLNFVSLGQENLTEKINNSGLSFHEPRKQNGVASWDEALEHSATQFQGAPFRPSVSSTSPANVMGIHNPETVTVGQPSIEYGFNQEAVANSKSQLSVSSTSPSNVMGANNRDGENVMIRELSTEDYGFNLEGNRINYSRTRDPQETSQSAHSGSPISSCFLINNDQVLSRTMATSDINSVHTSKLDVAQSDGHQASSRDHSFFNLQQSEDRPVINSHIDVGLLNSYFSGSHPTDQSDYQGKQLSIPGLNFVSLGQENLTEKINNSGLSFHDPRKQNGVASWDEALEHSATQFQGAPFRPSVSSTSPANVMGIHDPETVTVRQPSIEYGFNQEAVANSKSQLSVSSTSPSNVMGVNNWDGENVMIGELSIEDYGFNLEVVANSKSQLQWQIASEDDSSHVAAWPMGQNLNTELVNDLLTTFQEQEGHYVDVDNVPVSFSTNSDKGNESFMPNEFHLNLSNSEVEGLLTSDLDTEKDQVNEEDLGHYSSTRHPLIDCSTAGDEVFNKFDCFSRWMSKELGEVDGAHVQSSSGIYWSTVESGNAIEDSGMSPQVHDAYLLSPPSLSQDQLFSILDFSPNWAYTGMETKVLITGTFLKDKNDAMKCKWSCMFGEVEVLAEVLADGVLRCRAPAHAAGRVPFYITCSNRVACSEVREFEYRIGHSCYMDTDTYGGSTTEMILRVRLGKLLSLDSVGYANTLSNSAGEKSHISSKISSLLKEDDNEWFQMEKLTTDEEFSLGEVKERLLQRILKDKLHAWLLHKVADDGKGPSVLDEEGQGVLHLAAALGYDWAIAPTIVAGVNINFRDVNGWTALHWAASCGREQTVIALVALGGAPGALTQPTPEFPYGRAPADLASINGHKGMAGYLAEASLEAHLEALTLETFGDGNASEVPRVKAIQTIAQLSATQYIDADIDGQPLRDSLTAAHNAVQAAARIIHGFLECNHSTGSS